METRTETVKTKRITPEQRKLYMALDQNNGSQDTGLIAVKGGDCVFDPELAPRGYRTEHHRDESIIDFVQCNFSQAPTCVLENFIKECRAAIKRERGNASALIAKMPAAARAKVQAVVRKPWDWSPLGLELYSGKLRPALANLAGSSLTPKECGLLRNCIWHLTDYAYYLCGDDIVIYDLRAPIMPDDGTARLVEQALGYLYVKDGGVIVASGGNDRLAWHFNPDVAEYLKRNFVGWQEHDTTGLEFPQTGPGKKILAGIAPLVDKLPAAKARRTIQQLIDPPLDWSPVKLTAERRPSKIGTEPIGPDDIKLLAAIVRLAGKSLSQDECVLLAGAILNFRDHAQFYSSPCIAYDLTQWKPTAWVRASAPHRDKRVDASASRYEGGILLTQPEISAVERAANRAADKLADDWKAHRTSESEAALRLKAATLCFGNFAQARLRELGILPRGGSAKLAA